MRAWQLGNINHTYEVGVSIKILGSSCLNRRLPGQSAEERSLCEYRMQVIQRSRNSLYRCKVPDTLDIQYYTTIAGLRNITTTLQIRTSQVRLTSPSSPAASSTHL